MGEVWPTGGWGSLEYASVGFTPGQVIGGRWKPLHYFMAKTLYQDVAIICGSTASCFVKNDNGVSPFVGTAVLQAVHIATGAVSQLGSVPINLPIGAGVAQWFCLDGSAYTGSCNAISSVISAVGCNPNGTDCVLRLQAIASGSNTVVNENVQLWATPGQMAAAGSIPQASVTATVTGFNSDGTINIAVTSTATALYVHLSTLAQGRFSDSAFVMPGATTVNIAFIPFGEADIGTLTDTLRIEHIAMYL
jgi:beta-mannosidase